MSVYTRRSARRHLHNLRAGSSSPRSIRRCEPQLGSPRRLVSSLRPLKRLCLHRDAVVRAKEYTQSYASDHEGSPASLISLTPYYGDVSPGYFRRREAITGLRGGRMRTALPSTGSSVFAHCAAGPALDVASLARSPRSWSPRGTPSEPLEPGARTPRPPESARGARITL